MMPAMPAKIHSGDNAFRPVFMAKKGETISYGDKKALASDEVLLALLQSIGTSGTGSDMASRI